MSETEDPKLQFRVLRRQFLFRIVDAEVLSAHALGDANKLLGQFVALLFFISLLLSFPLLGFNDADMTPSTRIDFALSMQHFLIATSMLGVGIFSVLSWDSIFPDRRDVLVLAPLPVRARTLFLAKAAATATALTLVVVALNAVTGLGWPLAFASLAPSGFGFLGVLRSLAAYWLAIFAAGAFIYFSLLSAHGLAAQVLPRRLFLRISGFLQMAALSLFVSTYFLEPAVSGLQSLDSPELQRWMSLVPTYWFVGLYNQLAGSMYSSIVPLAQRAWSALALVTFVAAVVYMLSYMRTIRQTLEEPEITPSPRGLIWLPRFGDRVQTAIGQFTVRSLARSRQHRLILAFYLGFGLAFTILLVQTFLDPFPTASAPLAASSVWREPITPVLGASIMMIVSTLIGVRVAFSFPLDLPANWIFRAVGVRPGPQILTATRRALLFLSVAPVWLATAAAICLRSWPWNEGVGHLLLFALLGVVLTDFVLYGFRKIPFTCSYLPGRLKAHMIFPAAIGLVLLVSQCVTVEERALQKPRMTVLMLTLILSAAVGLRWRVMTLARSEGGELQFEEDDPSALLDLGISRDGGIKGRREEENS